MSKPKPTFEFVDGVLHIDTKLVKMRLQWQPEPLAEELSPGGHRWRRFWPEFRIVRPQTTVRRNRFSLDVPMMEADQSVAEMKNAAFAAFRAELPDNLVRIVEPFGSHQWALLSLLHAEPRATDLARNNPVLAYALASSDQLRRSPPEAAAVQALWYNHHKQRKILAWLGFPGTEALVRLIRKIPPESASPPMLRILRNAISRDPCVLELLTHLPVINAGVVELVTQLPLRELVTPKLLLEISTTPDNADNISVSDMILGGLDILQEVAPGRKMKPFSNTEQVRRFQQEMDQEYQAHQERCEEIRREAARIAELRRQRIPAPRAKLKQLPYPPPPIPGTRDIVPVTSESQLRSEGRLQMNCVGSYSKRVKRGQDYIYRVMAPERATLMIHRGADGCWHCAELKARGNRHARDATIRHVEVWLAQYRVSV